MIPDQRLFPKNDSPVRQDGDHVVYWMNASRRPRWNYALEYAVQRAVELKVPLIVVEALSCSYRWASDRQHAFVLQGMADNHAAFAKTPVAYHPYVEPERGAGRGLHQALAQDACLVVTDEWPCFELPAWVDKVAASIDVAMVAVDSCGLLPLAATPKVFTTAYSFRRWLQKNLLEHLEQPPRPDPLEGVKLKRAKVPAAVLEGWPAYDPAQGLEGLADLPIDHEVPPVPERPGGYLEGQRRVTRFAEERLADYGERNRPDQENSSGLSPWLHYGHTSAHEMLAAVAEVEGWAPAEVQEGVTSGKREGWWSMSPAAEGFMDELVTWRELGLNFNHHRPEDYDQMASLPDWAKTTIEEHRHDPRPEVYSHEQFEQAETHDELWNAAQNQLRRDGIIHNYLRMLWGKKIYHWSDSPEAALETMLELNNRWALDGRDPNSTSGIFWVLGRYDRAWGPVRQVFGKLRYMTSDSTARKYRVKDYVARYARFEQAELF